MSLIDEYSDDYTILDKTTQSDGYGGYTTVWKDGATIKGAMALASDTEIKRADAMGEKITHTLLIDKNISLDYHAVLRRSDGQLFRVTTSGDEYTPNSSRLNKRKVSCEEWELPSEV